MPASNCLVLSSLPDELLELVVERVQRIEDIMALSLVSQTFTPFCQAQLFRVLHIGGDKRGMVILLRRNRRILLEKPSLAKFIRCIRLAPYSHNCRWLFHDSDFMSIIQILGMFPRPPEILEITPYLNFYSVFGYRTLAIKKLLQSFLPTSLTTLIIKNCYNVPLTLFLVSPNLRKVKLDSTGLSRIDRDDNFDSEVEEDLVNEQVQDHEENAWYGREAPTLVDLRYRMSTRVTSALLHPPSHAPQDLVIWSELRNLSTEVIPADKRYWEGVQDVISRAQYSLANLDLTLSTGASRNGGSPLLLSRVLDISGLCVIETLSLPVFIDGRDPKHSQRMDDLSDILSTLPKATRLSKLGISFTVGSYTFASLEDAEEALAYQAWDRLATEATRVSRGRGLSLEIRILWSGFLNEQASSRIHGCLVEKLASISALPGIALKVEVYHSSSTL